MLRNFRKKRWVKVLVTGTLIALIAFGVLWVVRGGNYGTYPEFFSTEEAAQTRGLALFLT